MTPQSDLEVSGNLFTHPFAELLAELAAAHVSGALRVENKDRKSIIYFAAGRIVFAAANARSARLFQLMLDGRRLSKDDLAKIPNFQNDLEFAAYLEEKNFLSTKQCAGLFSEQIEKIIVDVLAWEDGAWSFSSLTRVREGLEYNVETQKILFDYARCLSTEKVLKRFRSLTEQFHRSAAPETVLALSPDEAFILSRTDESQDLTVADVLKVSPMTEAKALHAIYTLWLGGLVVRVDWQPAFARETIAAMKGAKLELKTEAKRRVAARPQDETLPTTPAVEEPKEPAFAVPTVEEYLKRVENAETYYDVLGIDVKADLAAVKRAYFALAKAFHPDKFHTENAELLHRVQDAFTEMMQAHEALKTTEARDLYDYRIRKELAEREKAAAAGESYSVQLEQASQQFEKGFSLLMDDEPEAAAPFLARAVHYAPKVARYHAYYGKALSFDEKQRHKAEAEMQAAIKADPDNPTFRILLAEFFVHYNLLKRAEGELGRLLAIFPSNREAQEMLASLQKPAR